MSEARRLRRKMERVQDKALVGVEERKLEAEKSFRMQFRCPKCLGNTFRVLAGIATLDVLCTTCFHRTPLATVSHPKIATKRNYEDLPSQTPHILTKGSP